MGVLEKMDPRINTVGSPEEVLSVLIGITATQKVSIVDAIAEVQALDKPVWLDYELFSGHQCGPSSIPGLGVKCGLSLLLVRVLAPRDLYPDTPVFPSPQKPTFPNSNWLCKALRGTIQLNTYLLFIYSHPDDHFTVHMFEKYNDCDELQQYL